MPKKSFVLYSLRPEILVGEMDVSRRILVLDTSNFIYLCDKYFRTEGVEKNRVIDIAWYKVAHILKMLITNLSQSNYRANSIAKTSEPHT